MNLFELFVKIGVDDKASPAMKNTQKNSETLANKIKVMSAQFDAAKENVNKLTDAFNKSVKETGEASKETQDLARKLDDAEKEALKLAKGLDAASDEANEASRKFSKVSDITSNASNGVDMLGKSLSVTGNIASKLANISLEAITIAFEAAAVSATAFLTTLTALNVEAIKSYSNFEQLAGGAEKIFDQMSQTKILQDANKAYQELGLSANQYLAVINDVGATFAATMGDEAGYDTARKGLIAISDYASGTGKSVEELSAKFTLITRSTSSYQSIADQFSGILPATSKDFLYQAQSVGILSDKYEELTQVPISEYQFAVAAMLEKGVAGLGLAGNTVAEANSTISGSIASTKSAWEDLMVAFASGGEGFEDAVGKFFNSALTTIGLIVPRIGTVISNAAPFVGEAITFLIGEIPSMIGENLPVIANATIGIFNQIGESVKSNQDAISDAIVSLFEHVASIMTTDVLSPSSLTIIGNLALSMVNALTGSYPIIAEALANLLLDMSEQPQNEENIKAMTEAMIALFSALAVAMLENTPLVYQAMFNILSTMLDVFNDEEVLQLLEDAVKLFSVSIVEHFNEVGSIIVASMKEGIERSWENLATWFKGLFGDLIGIAKKILGIASPSKVFKRIGLQTAQGYQIGFDDEFSHVKDDMEKAMKFDDMAVNIGASVRRVGSSAGANHNGAYYDYGYPQNVNVTVTIDENVNAMGLARELLPFLKIAAQEAYA